MLQRTLRPMFVCAALVAAAEPGPAVAEAEAPSVTAGPRLVRQHELGLGYQGITFGTEAGDRYVLHGPALSYDYFRGRRWGGMVRLSGALLVAGRMTGPSGEFRGGLGDVYDQRRYAVDVMLMAGRRIPLRPRLTVTAAAGAHLNGFTLTGTRYSPVENISVGLGGLGKLDYPLNHWLGLSGQLVVGLQPFDLVDHRNPAGWVIPFTTTVALAARH
jgi:hypothetical protein